MVWSSENNMGLRDVTMPDEGGFPLYWTYADGSPGQYGDLTGVDDRGNAYLIRRGRSLDPRPKPGPKKPQPKASASTLEVWRDSSLALKRLNTVADVVQGLVPVQGITWLYGPSMSFKSFIALSIGAAVARGGDWLGRRTSKTSVVYLGAEGGNALHIRHEALNQAAGSKARMFVLQERPAIGTEAGAERLAGVLCALNGCGIDEERDWSEDFAETFRKYEGAFREVDRTLCIIDTYSQTSGSDDKAAVAAYMKTLRDLIDRASAAGHLMTFIVIDHATKAGGSYIGSVAKLNDVDSQIEVHRDGDTMRATVYQRKSKDGAESAPVKVEMAHYAFGDVLDSYGLPVTTLIAQDGVRAAELAKVADGKAGVLLSIIMAHGRMTIDKMRAAFKAHPSNADSNVATVGKAFTRATDKLLQAGAMSRSGDYFSHNPAATAQL